MILDNHRAHIFIEVRSLKAYLDFEVLFISASTSFHNPVEFVYKICKKRMKKTISLQVNSYQLIL